MSKLLLLFVLLVLASGCTRLQRPTVSEWTLYNTLKYCGDDYSCFQDETERLTDGGVLSTLSRLLAKDGFVTKRIRLSQAGRDYERNLHFSYLEERRAIVGSLFEDRRVWVICGATLYYDPANLRIEFVNRSGACIGEPLPPMKVPVYDPDPEDEQTSDVEPDEPDVEIEADAPEAPEQ